MNRLRILIVDDQRRARQSLRALLATEERIGEIDEAGSGLEALSRVEAFGPDVILMDARMPEMDGLEATRQIKSLRPETRIILLSMYAEYGPEAAAAGADAFLAKGEAPGKLLEVLWRLVHGESATA